MITAKKKDTPEANLISANKWINWASEYMKQNKVSIAVIRMQLAVRFLIYALEGR